VPFVLAAQTHSQFKPCMGWEFIICAETDPPLPFIYFSHKGVNMIRFHWSVKGAGNQPFPPIYVPRKVMDPF